MNTNVQTTRPWSKKEDDLIKSKIPIEELMLKLGRSHHAITVRKHELGMSKFNDYTDTELLNVLDATYISNIVEINRVLTVFVDAPDEKFSAVEAKGKVLEKFPYIVYMDVVQKTRHFVKCFQWTDILRWNRRLLN